MNILDVLTELLFDPKVGADGYVRKEEAEAYSSGRTRSFARGGVRYRERRIQTAEDLEVERIAFRKSMARTDY